MIIKSVELENYMCYHGTQTIDLTPKPGKPIVIVHGNNGFGKTSLLKAISWCLFGKKNRRQLDPQTVFNFEAIKQGQASCGVKVRFEHAGRNYDVKRWYTRAGRGEKIGEFSGENCSCIDDAGQGYSLEQTSELIERIFPYSVSELFLFDGEDLARFERLVENEEDTQVDELKKKLELVLGIPTLQAARREASAAQKEFEQAYNALLGQNAKDQEVRASLLGFQHQIEETKRQIEQNTTERDRLVKELKGKENELAMEDAARNLVEKKSKILEEKVALEAELSLALRDRVQASSGLYIDLLRPRIQEAAAWFQSKAGQAAKPRDDAISSKAKLEMIGSVLNDPRQRCLCNRPLDIPSKTFLQTQEKTLRAAPAANGAGDESLPWDWIAGNLDRALKRQPLADFKDKEAVANQLLVKQTELDGHIDEIDRSLAGSEEGKISQLAAEVKQKSAAQQRINSELDTLGTRLAAEEAKAKALKQDILKGGHLDNKLKVDGNRVAVAKEAAETIEMAVEELRQLKRAEVEKYASESFTNMRWKKEYVGLRILKSYGMVIRTQAGDDLPSRSAGEGQIVALSLLTGLNRSAGVKAPIIMDTPFGRLDPDHRANVLKHLVNMGQQVVLLATASELNEHDTKTVEANTAQEWSIRYLTLYHSKFEQVR